MSRALILFGVIFILLGLLWPLLKKVGIGHLPGDIMIRRGAFTFYFPISTCIIVSVLLSIILWVSHR